MKNIIAAVKTAPKRSAALAMLVSAILVPATLFAWGPNRPTYTIEKPADHVTFNSITNNPNLGDERNFVTIREAATNGLWKDDQPVVPGKEYEVSIYVHNNAADNLKLTAENVTAKVNLPTTTAKSIDVQGFINSTNASPVEVYDHATFTSDRDFNLAYKPGSLKYYNNIFGKYETKTGTALPESIFTQAGAKLGYDKLDGKMPGCFQYAGVITFIVKPQFAFTVSKQVKLAGTTGWKENVAAKPGDTVEYLLKYTNTSGVQQDNVTFFDKLPAGMTYVDGSATHRIGATGAETKTRNNVTTQGVNLGSFANSAGAWLKFSAKVPTGDKLACGATTLRNILSVKPEGSNYNAEEDDAIVTIDNECKKIQVCDLASGTVVQIDEQAFDSKKYSKNLADCDKMKVCATDTKQIVVIKKSEYKSSVHTTDLGKCAPAPVTPAEMPATGIGEFVSILGAGSLAAATGYYLSSRRRA